jgi:hypothetical protein
MGTWGPGGFQNDTALDFAETIGSVDDIGAAFTIGDPGEPIDADKACEIVAAAECVAAMMGHPADDMPDSLLERVQSLGPPDGPLFHNARDHVSAVISRSELAELWADSDDPSAFNLAMTDLINRLNPDAKPKKGRRKKKPVFNPSPCAFCNEPMGEEEFGLFDISVDLGGGLPMKLGKWAHLKCLNARLHPNHIMQVWKFDPDETAAAAKRLLRGDDGE